MAPSGAFGLSLSIVHRRFTGRLDRGVVLMAPGLVETGLGVTAVNLDVLLKLVIGSRLLLGIVFLLLGLVVSEVRPVLLLDLRAAVDGVVTGNVRILFLRELREIVVF